MLKEEGYDYVWAKNGQEAMDIIGQQMPKLLITDIMMPQMDGLELIKNIRDDDEKQHLPIIVVSARIEDEDRIAGLEAGAEVYLGKPFVPAELMLRIRKLLEQREMLKLKYSKQIEEADRKNAADIEDTLKSTDRKFIEEANECIHKQIMNSNLSASILADDMNTTLATLNRRMKVITGMNTTNYIRMCRLKRAKQLLIDTDMPIGDIQAVCGFDTPSYFSRSFKGEFGITPTEFKRNNGKLQR